MRRHVQALRAVEPYLKLDALYVLGTNCVDNGPREGLDKFLKAASKRPGEACVGIRLCQLKNVCEEISLEVQTPENPTVNHGWFAGMFDAVGRAPPC